MIILIDEKKTYPAFSHSKYVVHDYGIMNLSALFK